MVKHIKSDGETLKETAKRKNTLKLNPWQKRHNKLWILSISYIQNNIILKALNLLSKYMNGKFRNTVDKQMKNTFP